MTSMRSVSSGGQANGSGANVTKPAGAANLDRVLAVAFADDDNSSAANIRPTGAGWTLLGERVEPATPGKNRQVRVYERTVNSDGASYPFARDTSGSWAARLFCLQDVPAGATIHVAFAAGVGTAAGTPAIYDLTAPSILDTDYAGVDPFLIVAYDVLSIDFTYKTLSFSTPAGMTNHARFASDNYLQTYAASLQLAGHPSSGGRVTTATGETVAKRGAWQAATILVAAPAPADTNPNAAMIGA